jgi:hypothetical protein
VAVVEALLLVLLLVLAALEVAEMVLLLLIIQITGLPIQEVAVEEQDTLQVKEQMVDQVL